MKRTIVILLSLLLLAACATGCAKGGGGAASITLDEPRYTGEAANGNPSFELKWSRVSGTKSYTIAIHAEMGDYTDRSEINVYEGRTSKSIVMLQGVYTDTVTYRIKVRAKNPNDAPWSNVWEIRFVDGEYTASPAEDFDAPMTPKPTVDPSKTPAPAKEPVTHSFPEPLLEFERLEQRREPFDLSKAVTLQVAVNHCEYGEPVQRITDGKVIADVIDALNGITVTGNHDGISSTGTYYGYSLYDQEDAYICGFAFQDGMLMENEGRYPIDGLDALLAVEGVRLDEEWEAYHAAWSERQDAYDEAFVEAYPLSVFAAGGYSASLLQSIPRDRLLCVDIRVMWYEDAGRLVSSNPAVVGPIYDALSAARVTGKADTGGRGQKWTVTIRYRNEAGETDSADLSFQGDTLLGHFGNAGTRQFAVTGLDGLFAAADADVLTYLAEKRNTPLPDPVY